MTTHQDEGWGWEPLESLEESGDNATAIPCLKAEDADSQGKRGEQASAGPAGITFSPSFQELEQAIGATLASNHSTNDLQGAAKATLPSRLSSTNLTNKKLQHHRMRQSHHHHQQQQLSKTWAQASQSHRVSAKTELAPLLEEEESRALIVFHSPSLPPSALSEAATKYGTLNYIRPEFHQRGVTFIAFNDLRDALSAKKDLASLLGAQDSSVHFSTMVFLSNSNSDEAQLIIENLPHSVEEKEIEAALSHYGPLRSFKKTATHGDDASLSTPAISYAAEFFNILDARLAMSELSAKSTSLWGDNAIVKVALLDQRKQQLFKQLHSTLSRWKAEMAMPLPPVHAPVFPASPGFFPISPQQGLYAKTFHYGEPLWNGGFNGMMALPNHSHATNLFMNSPADVRLMRPISPFHQADTSYYGAYPAGPMFPMHERTVEYGMLSAGGYLQEPISTQGNDRMNMRNNRPRPLLSKTEQDYALDLQRISEGQESRTTVMVRNIPNKYTQQMLLEEVNGSFQGTYDFFYLPIDFKNHCNVGYGFINFVDPKFIVPFVEKFHGQKWRNFNSEKVCAVTFARIQGKNAMISRFQNSSLLEKENEYKPLLFFSSGPNQGQPEPFPSNRGRFNNGCEDNAI